MRLAFQDHLLTCNFWLMDIALVSSGAAPILTPLYGFSSITAPEITIDVQDITEGNWFFKRKVLKRTADVGNITLQRGVTFHDTDFYSWIMNALAGENLISSASTNAIGRLFGRKAPFNPRRNLLLLHFFAHNPLQGLLGMAGSVPIVGGAIQGIQAGLQGAGALADSLIPNLGPLDSITNVAKLIPARAFTLSGCIPMRYKTGSDFEGSSAQVSIQELELAVESMEQVVLSL